MRRDASLLRNIMGINRRNIELIRSRNPRSAFPLVDDKIRTKELLAAAGVPSPRTLRVVDNFLAVDRAISALRAEPSFVVKPARGRAGGGVLLVRKLDDGSWRTPSGRAVSEEDLRKHFGDILFGVYSFGAMDDRALVEKRIEPHELFTAMYANGIPDIRVILLDDRPVMSMLRVPTEASNGKANLHQGGIGVEIDLATGRTGKATFRGRAVSRHPDSGAATAGLEIPFWEQVAEYAVRASRAVPLKYIGVDIVIDRADGPLVLEVNARPGLQIQVINRTGLRTVVGLTPAVGGPSVPPGGGNQHPGRDAAPGPTEAAP